MPSPSDRRAAARCIKYLIKRSQIIRARLGIFSFARLIMHYARKNARTIDGQGDGIYESISGT